VLARHGEPAISRKVKLTAQGYREFWAAYEERGLLPGQTPPNVLRQHSAEAGVLLASTRPRAIESALAVAEGREVARDPIFIRLSPKWWGVVARIWWWVFDHHDEETKRQAVIRSHEAADRIEALAAQGQNVVVLAHGFFNYMVGRALVRRGWRLAESQGWKYWSVRRFERK
jgi:hypothetical protein